MRKQVHLEVTPQQLALLDEEKRKTGAPRNELIRRAIEAYLQRQGKKFHVKHDGETSKGADHGKQRDNAGQSAE